MIYTLYLATVGAYFTLSLTSRISSIPRFEAASISITSLISPLVIPSQTAQVPQGSKAGPFRQLMALAIIFAVEVFPVPLGPENR